MMIFIQLALLDYYDHVCHVHICSPSGVLLSDIILLTPGNGKVTFMRNQ